MEKNSRFQVTLANCRAVWDSVVADDATLLASLKVKPDRSFFLGEDQERGPSLGLPLRITTIWAIAAERGDELDKDRELKQLSDRRRNLWVHLGSKVAEDPKALAASRKLRPGELEILIRHVETIRGGLRWPYGDELVTREFVGEKALVEFIDWIRIAPQRKSDRSLLPENLVFHEGHSRPELLDAVLKRICDPSERKIVQNVWARSMWSGLTAFAGALCRRLHELAHDVPYVYVTAQSRANNRRALDFPHLVAQVKDYFDGNPLKGSTPIADPEAIDAAIQAIRRRMLTDPIVLILDGYAVPRGAWQETYAFVRDDRLQSLVAALSQPLTIGGRDENPKSLDAFARNRIVILSDGELKPERIPNVASDDIKWPGEHLGTMLRESHRTNRKEFDALCARSDVFEEAKSEIVYNMADALLTMKKAAGSGRPDAASPDETAKAVNRIVGAAAENDILEKRLVKAFVSEVGESAKLGLIALVAISPDGIREPTFLLLLERAERVGMASGAEDGCGIWPRPGRIAETIAALFDFCAGFPQVFAEVEEAAPDGSVARRLDFALPGLRELFRAELTKLYLGQIRKAHRLVAEEALRQLTDGLREVDDRSVNTLRPYRRAVQALYHGIESLDVSGAVRNDVFAVLPVERSDAWDWLALFLFRGLLERAPSWRMSRIFGEDRLKAEILERIEAVRQARNDRPETERDIGSDIRLAQTHVALLLGRAVDEDLSPADPSLSHVSSTQLRKRQIDRQIEWNDLVKAKELCKAALDGIVGIGATANVLGVAQDMAAFLGVREPPPTFFGNAQGHQFIDQQLMTRASAIDEIFHPNLKDGSECPDFIYRLAEIAAVDADLMDGESHARKSGSDDVAVGSAAVIDKFFEAFSLVLLAERFRRRCFQHHPFSLRYAISGHASRVAVRIALKLETLSKRLPLARDPSTSGPGFFGLHARSFLDRQTRHLYRFPRERAGALILECAINRKLADGEADLHHGLRLLERAEQGIWRLDQRASVRFRFSLERGKIYRELAAHRLKEGDAEGGAAYLRAARYDLDLMSNFIKIRKMDVRPDHKPTIRNVVFKIQENALGHLWEYYRRSTIISKDV